MARSVIWRVRVRRSIEVWVDVEAVSGVQAELEAAKVPGVLSVFGMSAIRGDEAARPEPPEGVKE